MRNPLSLCPVQQPTDLSTEGTAREFSGTTLCPALSRFVPTYKQGVQFRDKKNRFVPAFVPKKSQTRLPLESRQTQNWTTGQRIRPTPQKTRIERVGCNRCGYGGDAKAFVVSRGITQVLYQCPRCRSGRIQTRHVWFAHEAGGPCVCSECAGGSR